MRHFTLHGRMAGKEQAQVITREYAPYLLLFPGEMTRPYSLARAKRSNKR